MKMRKSLLHGRMENEVEDFVALLEIEFDLEVQSVSVSYTENFNDDEKIVHVFHVCDKETSSFEI